MISRLLTVASAVFMDAVRRKVVWVVLLFAAVLAVAIPSLPSYGVGVVSAVFREVSLSLMYASVIVVTLALAANRVPAEVERRTVYNVLARSVRRWEYVVGTWLGILAVIGTISLLFALIAIGIGWATYGAAMWRLLEGALGIWLEAGVLAAFCMVVSAAVGPVVVAVASLAFLFIAHARTSLLVEGTLAWNLYPSLDTFNIIAPVAHGQGVTIVYLGVMLLVFAAWSGVLLLVASAVFGRRDL